MKRFRYCHYLGKYFCSSCHGNFLEVIPANVIKKWDFTKYPSANPQAGLGTLLEIQSYSSYGIIINSFLEANLLKTEEKKNI